jgi:hypothetical protein
MVDFVKVFFALFIDFLRGFWRIFTGGKSRIIYTTDEFEVAIISQWEITYKRGAFHATIFTEPLQTEGGWARGIHITENLKKNPEKNALNNNESDKTLIMRNIEEAMIKLHQPFKWVME